MRDRQTELSNETVRAYSFLREMYMDSYFPDELVDKGRDILLDLCFEIEETKPSGLEELYELTHAATDRFNELQEEFDENGSELETGARESIAADFEFIANAYGFSDADMEELIATRDW